MKKRLFGLLLSSMLASMCIGCNTETTTSGQPETATESAAAEISPAQTTEQTEVPLETVEQASEVTEEPHTHNYTEEITTAATCEADGLKTFTCECDDTYTEMVPATGHIYENYVSNNDATYLANGTETAKCNTCELTDTRTAEGSKLEYTYTEMNATMYATQTVNVRNLPSADGEKIGSLSTNQEITVVGQCVETDWYKFNLDGQTAFVSNSYLSTEKVESQQAPPAQEAAQVSNVPNIADYPERTWIDMGDYFFYITPADADGKYGVPYDYCDGINVILEQRFPGNWTSSHGFYTSDNKLVSLGQKNMPNPACQAFVDANCR